MHRGAGSMCSFFNLPLVPPMLLLRMSFRWGLALMLLMGMITAVFDGLGISRASDHYDTYYGSLSWARYQVTFRPVGAGWQPASLGFAPTLRYGFSLAHHVALRANILQTEVPLSEVGPLFYDTTRFPGRFSPDTVYAAWLGVRGHFLSSAFGTRPAAVVLSCRAVAAPAATPAYSPRPQLLPALRLYAWVSLTLALWFGAAAAALLLLPDFHDVGSRVVALGLVLLYAAGRGYVDWLDYHTGQEFPIFGPLLALLLLLAYAYQVRQPAATEAPLPA